MGFSRLKRGLYFAGLGLAALWMLFGALVYFSRFLMHLIGEYGG